MTNIELFGLESVNIEEFKQSNNKCDYTIASIFVNPKQFSLDEDMDTYPQNLRLDLEALSPFHVDAIFLPSDLEMFPEGFSTFVKETNLSSVLEGKSRPSFFQGVTTVVNKLFNIVQPTHGFFGEKDAQQLLIVKKMVKDMAYPIDIIACPIIRQDNGLAMSSRNSYLSKSEEKIESDNQVVEEKQ